LVFVRYCFATSEDDAARFGKQAEEWLKLAMSVEGNLAKGVALLSRRAMIR
jgi:hypothetical protein